MREKYALGLDFGTNSVRALIVNVNTGEEIGTAVVNYAHGEQGVIISDKDPHLARQHPEDYVKGLEEVVKRTIENAKENNSDFDPVDIIGIGVDTTGSTPIPVDRDGKPLAFYEEFSKDPNAMAWLWKDHTSYQEAEEITNLARQHRPHFLAKCGGTYSSEWFWSKLLHCRRVAPKVFASAYTWVECADWIPAILTGTEKPSLIKRGICPAGHKAMANPAWQGYPDETFLSMLDPELARIRQTLPDTLYCVKDKAGELTQEWAEKLSLKPGIPVAVGAFDAHLGAVGCGIAPGILTKIIGTSTCDMMVAPLNQDLPDIPGLCGIVPESILPGMYGLEAGQSAFGDIYNWFVQYIQPGGPEAGSHETLTKQAEKLKPGESGLLALDWHNGNRTILIDPQLTGAIVGLTLITKPAEIYRAWIEATAFGARVIMERFEEYGLKAERVINCGGIAFKNPLVMQILADVMGKTMEISRSEQTCALGSAICGAVVAGKANGGYDNFEDAVKAMTGVRPEKYVPIPENQAIYNKLYKLYRQLHDAFGTREYQGNLANVMKELLQIRRSIASEG